ncbi:nonribosomal peptide synthetase MxaA [Ancylobacter terrae]|uniref:nonribosomal peptide synthetase MxaA n=1 Tax=Ancylobacter sp. sgz301288 TaxID=3342077 RepID=UPI00385DFA7C
MGARGGMLALCLLAGLGAAPPALAQVRSVELYAPRPFGHVLGDALPLAVEIELDEAFRLDPASLPRPRAVDYWLDLRDVRLEERGTGGGIRRYVLRLDYQTFYAPLEPKRMDIPPLALAALDGERRVEIRVPGWSFVMSPLREIVASAGSSPMTLRPDIEPGPIPTAGAWRGLAAGIGTATLALLVLAWQMGWGPFGRRRARPFARADRTVRAALHASVGSVSSSTASHPSSTSLDSSSTYGKGLIALHRAFDATAGKGLFAEDLPAFFGAHPEFRAAEAEIGRLFAASRRAFFASDLAGALGEMPPAALAALSGRLRAIERGTA